MLTSAFYPPFWGGILKVHGGAQASTELILEVVSQASVRSYGCLLSPVTTPNIYEYQL